MDAEVSILPPKPRVPGEPPALSLRHLSKRFGGEQALDDVSLDLLPGEVLGLLGQNGSGKSTLIKVLAGFHVPEPGAELQIHGEVVKLPVPPGTTEREGLAFVHQHLGLVTSLTVLENLRMNTIANHTRWWVNWREESRRARETFTRFGLSIDPDARVADLPQVERALVAIVRAFEAVQSPGRAHAGILVLDEPTPFLPTAGVEQLFSLVRAIVRDGASVIFVSHDVDEVKQITDRATVLRDGRLAGTLVTAEATHEDFIELIVGRRIELFHTQPHDLSTAPIAVAVRDVSGGALTGVSLDIRRGEILGFAGLIGSGFDDLPYLLYGARTATSGTMLLPDKGERSLRAMSPHAAIADGITLLPSDRLGAAGIGALSVADNVSLPVLHLFRSLLLDWGAIFDRAAALGCWLRGASEPAGHDPGVLVRRQPAESPAGQMDADRTTAVDAGRADPGCRRRCAPASVRRRGRGRRARRGRRGGQHRLRTTRADLRPRADLCARCGGGGTDRQRDQQGRYCRTVPAQCRTE